jgi:16S rRNA (cytosine967-C5)-methyltransferase
VAVLVAVEAGRGNARELLDASLQATPDMDPRDRDLAREIVYGALRRLPTLDHLLGWKSRIPVHRLDPTVRAALRAAAYQVLFLDRIPPAAAVGAAVTEAGRAAGPRAAAYANAVLRGLAREVHGRPEGDGDDHPRRSVPTGDGRHVLLHNKGLPDPARDEGLSLAARWSLPVWLVRRWRERMGPEGFRAAAAAACARPGTWLRPVAGREDATRAALVAAGVAFEQEGASPAFLLRGAGAVEALPGYAEGLWTVQDPSSSRAVALLDPRPGATVLEIGAGRGGKTVALAAAVAPGGRVVAVDRDGGRLAMLRETLRRLRLGGVEVIEADALAAGALPPGPFDLALVDAPCSNTGVLARRVEARERLRPADIEHLAGRGRRLAEAALARLRPGGVLVHAVCSLEPEEGPVAIRRALRAFPGSEIEVEEPLVPVPGRRDGGYAVRVRRGPDPAPRARGGGRDRGGEEE